MTFTLAEGVPVAAIEAPARLLLEPAAVLEHFAGLLAEGADLPEALRGLARGLGLRLVVLHDPAGRTIATGGDRVDGVPGRAASSVHVAVPGRHGSGLGRLTAVGAVPAQLPTLQAAAAIAGLALGRDPAAAAGALLDADEQGYDQLADLLHDGPVQLLVAARYAADAAVRGGSPVQARDAVQLVLVEVRRALWQLRPRGRDGLGSALSALSAHLVEAGGPALILLDGAGADDTARGVSAALAYRLVQAVAKTSAPAVRVSVRHDDALLVLTVQGGAALVAPQRWTHRARALGGDFSAADGRLRMALPLPDQRTDL